MDIMFDQQYMVQGEEVPIKLGFKDVIFVMEDVDAASRVVHRRDGKTTASVTHTEVHEAPKQKSPWTLFLESNDDDCKELVEKLMEKSPRLKAAALSSTTLCATVTRLGKTQGLGIIVGAMETDDSTTSEAKEKAKDAINAFNESLEVADRYIKGHATVLKRLIEAGAEVDKFLEDCLLAAPSTETNKSSMVKSLSTGYGGASQPPPVAEEQDEDDDAKTDSATMLATLASLMESKKGGDDAGGGGPLLPSAADKKDKLNLSGLLNVLDGVVDTPERILIMTTNHPEHLDPALIRPGRIDKKILLGYMGPTHTISMIEHYFEGVLDAGSRNKVNAAIVGCEAQGFPALNMTPAQIEQLCAEHDQVEDLIKALESKGRPPTLMNRMPKRGGSGGLTRTLTATIHYDH